MLIIKIEQSNNKYWLLQLKSTLHHCNYDEYWDGANVCFMLLFLLLLLSLRLCHFTINKRKEGVFSFTAAFFITSLNFIERRFYCISSKFDALNRCKLIIIDVHNTNEPFLVFKILQHIVKLPISMRWLLHLFTHWSYHLALLFVAVKMFRNGVEAEKNSLVDCANLMA